MNRIEILSTRTW